MTVQISTFEEALAFLSEYSEGLGAEAPDALLDGEMAVLRIEIDGPRYKATIPGDLARGLWEFQEAIYRAAAFALYQVEDIRHLTSKDRKNFELVFEVRENSTDLIAGLASLLTALKEGIINMDSKHKAYMIVAIAALVASGYVAVNVAMSHVEAKREELKQATAIRVEEEKTRQFEILARAAAQHPVVGAFNKAVEDGTKAVISNVPDAERLKLGRVKLNKAEMDDIRAPAARAKSTGLVVEEDFRVFGAVAKDPDVTKYHLMRMTDGAEFTILVSHGDFPADKLQKIWAALQARVPVKLEVNLTMNKDSVRSAVLVNVP